MVLLTEATLLCCKANSGQHGSTMSGIYLSYRRMESAAYAGRLFDHLSRHFGRGSVFMDIGSRTTKLYDHRGQKVLLEDMERILY
jgi:hypothetical protein